MRIRYADLINIDVRDVPLLMAADDKRLGPVMTDLMAVIGTF